jgi:hypothetical protein
MKYMVTPLNVDRRLARFLAIGFLIAQAGFVSAGQDVTYNFSQTITTDVPNTSTPQTDSVIGSITTDGTIGNIAPSNVVSWNIDLIDTANSANDYTLTPTDSTLYYDYGSAPPLSASSNALDYNYGIGGQFLIQANSPGFNTGYHYFCVSSGYTDCWAGETLAPYFSLSDGVDLPNPGSVLATNGVVATPESPSMPMLFLCLAALGAAFVLKLLASDQFRTSKGLRFRGNSL